jgi:signal transduction histidine kinase
VAVDDLLLDERVRLEDLVDREGLEELCKTFVGLFGIPLRIYSSEGTLLADAASEHELCAYVNGTREGHRACVTTVGAARARDPAEMGDVAQPCFTGASYRIVALEYDRRRVGRLIVGPFLPAGVTDAPESLFTVAGSIDKDRAKALLAKMPRVKTQTVTRIVSHFKAALDLILFSGHKAFVTSTVHVASVRESYRQLEERAAKIQDAYDRLKELDHLKSNFLATVSHELRTPLTSILGYSEMLVEGLAGPLSGEQLEFVKTIQDKGGHLLSLIMGLLDLGKLESGTMRMIRRLVALPSVLDEVVSTLAPTARKKGVKLELDVGADLSEVRGDPERLRQVFLNLVENGIKFTPAGGTVTLAARMAGLDGAGEDEEGLALLAPTLRPIEVRVIDTGIGIPVRERARVFDAFYQIDSSSTRQYGGTGLGLSIVKHLVTAHGGSVRIQDSSPQGTTFVVLLPQPTPSAVPAGSV